MTSLLTENHSIYEFTKVQSKKLNCLFCKLKFVRTFEFDILVVVFLAWIIMEVNCTSTQRYSE